MFRIINEECRDAMAALPPDSIQCIVTDPPYGLSDPPDPVALMTAWVNGQDYHHSKKGFMGKEWDSFVPQPAIWKEALRVLKPGGYALVFAGSRTQDWMAMSLRFAGFEIVDTIMWVYAQGMPKSHNISKAIGRRKHPTLKQENVAISDAGHFHGSSGSCEERDITGAGSDEAARWEGWGTQLKPAYEPILVCRKPIKGTFAKNVMAHGVGGMHIDACRIAVDPKADATQMRTMNRGQRHSDQNDQEWGFSKGSGDQPQVIRQDGRWPANLAHDGSDAVLALFPESAGQQAAARTEGDKKSVHTFGNFGPRVAFAPRGDFGSSARFFFCAKPSTKERHLGMDNPGAQFKRGSTLRLAERVGDDKRGNHHPTVKPIKLMRWLVRLVCPKGGTVLDMFCGSGTTGFAAIEESFDFIGIEREPVYARISNARCSYAEQLMTGVAAQKKKYRKARRATGKFFKGDQLPLF